MTLTVTHWSSRTATLGQRRTWTWDAFAEQYLGRPMVAESKDALAAWSPATFRDDRRLDQHVEQLFALVLDHDDGTMTIDDAARLWNGVVGAVHTTFSHAFEHHRVRVVLLLSRPVDPSEHEQLWWWAHARVVGAGKTVDATTRNAGRIWFAPAHRPGAPYEVRRLSGDALDVDAALADCPAPCAVPLRGRLRGTAHGAPHDGPDVSRSGQDAKLAIALLQRGANDDEIAGALAIHSAKVAEKMVENERAAEDYIRRTIAWAHAWHGRNLVRMRVLRAEKQVLLERQGKPQLTRIRFELTTPDGEVLRARVVVPSAGYESARSIFEAVLPDLTPADLLGPGGWILCKGLVGRELDVALKGGRVVWMCAASGVAPKRAS